jgi:uncharacterized protein YegJ (DUF2314 family)
MATKKQSNIRAVCSNCIDNKKREFQNKHIGKLLPDFTHAKITFNQEKAKENMWVRVTDFIPPNIYIGKLNNEPVTINNISYGDEVTFHRKDIIELL